MKSEKHRHSETAAVQRLHKIIFYCASLRGTDVNWTKKANADGTLTMSSLQQTRSYLLVSSQTLQRYCRMSLILVSHLTKLRVRKREQSSKIRHVSSERSCTLNLDAEEPRAIFFCGIFFTHFKVTRASLPFHQARTVRNGNMIVICMKVS